MSRAPDPTLAETRAMLDDFTKDVECDTTSDKLWWLLTALMELCKAEGLDFHAECRAARADWLEHNTGVRK